MSKEIDITDVVEKSRQAFVDWGVDYIFGLGMAVPALRWLTLPVIRVVTRAIVKIILDEISQSVIMGAFFFNTAIRKASEAGDFVDAVNAKNALPEDVSDEEYKKFERAQMDAFITFASVG
jgi:hypothetical protein